MAYPFSNNQLESYLNDLQALQAKEIVLYEELRNNRYEKKAEIEREIDQIHIKLAEVRKKKLLPRDFDVFLSDREKNIAKYEEKNPPPKRGEKCIHASTELRLATYSDGSKHIWAQCLSCGGLVSSRKKINHPDWRFFSPVDENLININDDKYGEWLSKKSEYCKTLLTDGEKETEFNYEDFDKGFKLKYPVPVTQHECKHMNVKVVLRKYSERQSAVVDQCIICGKHVKDKPKSSVENIDDLPHFDEEIKGILDEEWSEWNKKYFQDLREEKSKFHLDVMKRIKDGTLTVVDASRFGTYYSSSEWQKTRLRILERDAFRCQACPNAAECVHHITYERLGCENDLDLISLCIKCHNKVHEIQNKYTSFSYRLPPSEIKCLRDRKC